jgi:poly(A) polymerase
MRRRRAAVQEVGKHFGVVRVRPGRDSDWYEVATFREDGTYSDARHPDSVVRSTREKDAARRDFTANGLYLDPLSGKVYDHVGGRADIEAGLIRAIGDPELRFKEDALRLLRAVRFAAREGFTIEPHTSAAMRLHKQLLRAVSPGAPPRRTRKDGRPRPRASRTGLPGSRGHGTVRRALGHDVPGRRKPS